VNKANLPKRDERIYNLRIRGASFAEIGKIFNISRERVRQLYLKMKDRKENSHSWPPLKKLLSNRTKNALNVYFKDGSIMENPQKIVDLGPEEIRRIKNIGEKSMSELAVILRALGFIKGDATWL
jgi:hypothetical protein